MRKNMLFYLSIYLYAYHLKIIAHYIPYFLWILTCSCFVIPLIFTFSLVMALARLLVFLSTKVITLIKRKIRKRRKSSHGMELWLMVSRSLTQKPHGGIMQGTHCIARIRVIRKLIHFMKAASFCLRRKRLQWNRSYIMRH